MFVKLSEPKRFWHYNAVSLTGLSLTIYNSSGAVVTTLTPTAVLTTPVDYFWRTAEYTFTTVGSYRLKWTATGYTNWEECIVTVTPPIDEYPNLTRKYRMAGSAWVTPQLYVLDADLDDVTDCALLQLAASVTSTKTVASFTIPAAAYITLAFDSTSPTYTVNLTAGVRTLLEVIDEINTAIRYGRAVTSTGKLRIQSDSTAETTEVVLAGDAATLTELGLTADTYSSTFSDPPLSLTAIDGGTAYETDEYVALAEGNYIFIWCDDTTVQALEDVFIYSDPSYSDINVEVVELTTSQALAGVELALLNTDGVTVRRGYTLINGKFYASVEPGEYYVVLRRDRCVFGYNNFHFTVVDRHAEQGSNDFVLTTTVMYPNYAELPIIGQDNISIMRAQFIDLQGNPVPGIKLLVSHNYIPFQMQAIDGTSVAVTGHPLAITADGMGAIAVPMVRGITVEVAVEGTSLRRTLIVPDQAEFNLLDHFGQDDLFDIIRLRVPAAAQVDV